MTQTSKGMYDNSPRPSLLQPSPVFTRRVVQVRSLRACRLRIPKVDLNMKMLVSILTASLIVVGSLVAAADEKPAANQHGGGHVASEQPHSSAQDCLPLASGQKGTTPSTTAHSQSDLFEGVQIETSDIKLYEQFFEMILQTPVIQTMDHPQVDSIRGYCYRGVLIVVRQDLRTPRPTGWVQINFSVPDAAALQEELEHAYRASSVYQLSEEKRAKIVRFRLKPDVRRGERKAVRLEVSGPEGFMIGFDQYK